MIAGVRPSDLQPEPRGAAAPVLRAQLEVVERLGSREPRDLPGRRAAPRAARRRRRADEATEDGDATLLADDDRARFTAVVPGRGGGFAPASALELAVAPEAVHLFDPDSGAALR